MINWWNTTLGLNEKKSLINSFISKKLSQGIKTEELEKQLSKEMDVPYVVVTNSGTSAIYISLLALGLKKNQEVIVPNLTWIATAQPVISCGAKPILIDNKSDLPLINEDLIQKKITKKTKGIIAVQFHGRVCNMEAINKIAKKNKLFVLEDACKSMFSRSKYGYMGTIGDVGCFSLGMVSLLTVGYGGFLVTKKKSIYEKAKLIRDHGCVRNDWDDYKYMGLNFKISDLLSSIGLEQLKRKENKINHINQIYDLYVAKLKKSSLYEIVPVNRKAGEIPICVDIICKNRNKFSKELKKLGIQTSKIHPPLSFAKYINSNSKNLKNSENFAKNGLMLPSGPNQPLKNVKKTIEILNKNYGNK
jgi:perosamine synthetase